MSKGTRLSTIISIVAFLLAAHSLLNGQAMTMTEGIVEDAETRLRREKINRAFAEASKRVKQEP